MTTISKQRRYNSAASGPDKNNNLALNSEKFEQIRHGEIQDIKSKTSYNSNQQKIPEQLDVKDLGIFMSTDAAFSSHYSKITDTAKRLTGWVLRMFKFRGNSYADSLEKPNTTTNGILLSAMEFPQNQGHN